MLTPIVISCQVDRDSREPRTDLSFATKAVASFVGFEKAFLCEGFGEIRIAERGQEESKNSVSVPLNHRLEVAEVIYQIA